ncbi:S-adenosyl-L-methionine-dependent methyltransferase [Coccomyxa subellipsoidea C-169]|uniref:S-adenosyl-L-methionine-dependent methyltransferase n=1 Tax=Coccomyxa subellipsoidea (strain C-169) TaxID=574566 RepID=I0Z6X6_COCSC|nr:S-adenosyl-L-methionine-dependent methyltransferase [Coccomyxa subellipsoidea C-169]EIE26395.1 S-adenosyl-L-methionine-dependent methyltransferase [Coccomyxa subellipsoidea C-169]|eukprot:XP_005650939.1 S-adenosyl-L-methionine-dependent methyltransferase [Coccomyxa subellipsoidea C-169]
MQGSTCLLAAASRPVLTPFRDHRSRCSQSHSYARVQRPHRIRINTKCAASAQAAAGSRPLRFIQHKKEALFFYAFLSQVYDYIVNPGHWTVDMRTEALEPAKLDNPKLKVVDVGGGTGFCTQGIVKTISPINVVLMDQSPQQLAKAKKKKDLQGVTIVEGDAEDLPFPTDSFDRYVSAGSIEYWPEPQRGIKEAYRVIKEGGLACMIGPVHPTFWLSRFFADMWMLFPTEDEYREWFTKAGFTDVKIKRIGPKWYRGVRRHGLIMGCSVTGIKPKAGDSPLEMGPKVETSGSTNNIFSFLFRLIIGSLAGFYYFVLPVYMWLKNLIWPRNAPGF